MTTPRQRAPQSSPTCSNLDRRFPYFDRQRRLELITGAAQEVVGVEHLESRIADGGTIRAYVGFEPSGKAHVGWKVLATNLRRMLDAEVNVLIFLADWHAWVNDKFGGDMDKIQTTGKYMEEVFGPARTSERG